MFVLCCVVLIMMMFNNIVILKNKKQKLIKYKHTLKVMRVYDQTIPDDKGLTNIELMDYSHKLKIPHFRGVFMLDKLPQKPHPVECGIVNFDSSTGPGTHWVCYTKNKKEDRIYFDSFGQITPCQIQKHLKTSEEYRNGTAVIQRNTDIVQRPNTHVCGHLCLFVLTSLMREHISYQNVLNLLNDGYTQGDW